MREQLQDRRLAPRFVTMGEIQAFLEGTPVYLLDLSVGGFAVQCRTPFVPSTTCTFVFRSRQRTHVTVRAVAMHCLHAIEAGESSYVAGFAFAPDTTPTERQHVDLLIGDVVKARQAVVVGATV